MNFFFLRNYIKILFLGGEEMYYIIILLSEKMNYGCNLFLRGYIGVIIYF